MSWALETCAMDKKAMRQAVATASPAIPQKVQDAIGHLIDEVHVPAGCMLHLQTEGHIDHQGHGKACVEVCTIMCCDTPAAPSP